MSKSEINVVNLQIEMTPKETDIFYMRRCFQLASCAMGRTAPNPLVGCVIVKDGRVLSEGFHQQYGGYLVGSRGSVGSSMVAFMLSEMRY